MPQSQPPSLDGETPPPHQQPTRKQRLAEWRVQREAERLQKELQRPKPPPPFRPTSSTASSTTPLQRPRAASTSSNLSSISNISGSTSAQRQRLAERRRSTMTAAAPLSVKRTTSTSSSTGSASTARSPSRSPSRRPSSPAAAAATGAPRKGGGQRGYDKDESPLPQREEESQQQAESDRSMQLILQESYYGVEYEADEYQEQLDHESEGGDSSESLSSASSPRSHEDIEEQFRTKMKEGDFESEQMVTVQSSSHPESNEIGNDNKEQQEEQTTVVSEVVSMTTAETTQVLEEFYAEPDEINPPEVEGGVEATISCQTTEISSETHVFHDEAEAFAYVRGEEDQVAEHTEVTRTIEGGVEGDNNTEEEEIVVVETTTTTTTTTATIVETSDDTLSSSSLKGEPSVDAAEQLKTEEALLRVIYKQRQARLIKMLVMVSILPLLALIWPTVCWLFPSSTCVEIFQKIPQMEAAKWKEFTSRFKTFSNGFLSKIGHPERYVSKAFEYCSSKWDDVVSNSTSLSKAKTLLSDSSEKLHHYMSALYNGSCSTFSSVTNACASAWDRVLPFSTKDKNLVESTRESLLDPFEADQQLLNEKLKALLLKQEAWALGELKRMKQRRAAHASVTDSILSDTRAMVMESLKEAKLVATYHIEAYTEAISDELIQSIQRELDEYDQSIREDELKQVEAVVEHEQHDLKAKTQQELEALEQLKFETDQELDEELDVEAHQVVSAKEKLMQELEEIAEFEKKKIEAEYQKVADTVSKLAETETGLLEANLADVENELVDLSTRKEEWIREEDTKLLNELEMLAKLETMRIAAERERALAEVAQLADQEAERIHQEREQAKALAHALELEEQRLVAERQRVEAKIAEAARRDAARLEEERKLAEEAILEAQKREHERIRSEALQAENELVQIKQQEEERIRMERVKAEEAIAEAVRAEEERLERERDALQSELAREAELEQERLREERVHAVEVLEQALEEQESELIRAQQEESEQISKEAAHEVEKVMAVEPIDVAAVVGSGGGSIKIDIVAETEVQMVFSDQEEPVIAIEQQNESSASMLPLSPPIPKKELYKLGLVSTAFLVLGLVSAYFLSARYKRLVARRKRQRALGFHARRKRWQRPVESSDSLEFAEEVVLLSSATEPELEGLGYSSDAYTVSEDLSQTSSVDELDEATLLSSMTITMPKTISAFADETEEEEDATAYFVEQRVTVERTVAENEEVGNEDAAESVQSLNESPTRLMRRSRRTTTTSSRRAFSPTS